VLVELGRQPIQAPLLEPQHLDQIRYFQLLLLLAVVLVGIQLTVLKMAKTVLLVVEAKMVEVVVLEILHQ
jgi:hypothetical protein